MVQFASKSLKIKPQLKSMDDPSCSHFNYRSHSHRQNCYHWTLLVIFFLSSLSLTISSATHRDKDELTQTKCIPIPEEKKFTLECPEDMKMVIREAYFSTSLDHNHHCAQSNYLHRTGQTETCYEDLRLQFNANCTTTRKCNFTSEVLSQCSEPGHIFYKYSCIAPYLLAHYCNSVLDRTYGYISSPTYPDYSSSIMDCSWTITALEGQKIELQILDTELTDPRIVKPKDFLAEAVVECTDSLTISADQKLITLCGDSINNLQTIKSKGPEVKLSYKQNEFRARRGWLVRYQVNGCPKLKDPFKGHIVEQNETSASMTCCEGYIFKDTREPKKFLTCLRNNWDGIVSSCVKVADIDAPETLPDSSVPSIDKEFDSRTNPPMEQLSKPIGETPKALFSNVVVPISLLVLAVVVLVLFVVIIVKCRSRRSKATLLTYTHEANVPLTNTSPVNV
ncbi:uncharacterized protein LOC107366727 [Tetranychus urticae]|nr:uncharacterized protein LOC107366727 [Tetranychus urticae]